jgi:hypothetical protein
VWRNSIGMAGVFLTSAAWCLFVIGGFYGWIGGFGSHYLTHPVIADCCLVVSLAGMVCAAFLKKASRLCGGLAGALVLLLWMGSEMVA